jgi:acylphosphatase
MIRQFFIVLILVVASCDKPASTRPATVPTSAPAVRQVHVFVRGKVQGVGFRAFTKERADEVEVKGWVKNLLDGRVEAVMQGRSDAIEKVLQGVRKGPRSSRVDGVEVKDEAIGEKFASFKVIEGQ